MADAFKELEEEGNGIRAEHTNILAPFLLRIGVGAVLSSQKPTHSDVVAVRAQIELAREQEQRQHQRLGRAPSRWRGRQGV